MPMSKLKRLDTTARYLITIASILVFSLAGLYIFMRPQLRELAQLATFLAVTAFISALAGYLVYRMGWMNHSPSLRTALLSSYALASLLIFINVWLTARLMFTSQHDLLLGTILLVFASLIAVALGYLMSSSFLDRIKILDQAARQIAADNLDIRVPPIGRDEVYALTVSFNQMVEKLKASHEEQRRVESLRRELIAWVSHDLQTPLTSVSAISEALLDDVVDDPETVRRYLRTIIKEIEYLSKLIEDLSQLAQLDSGVMRLEKQPVVIADLISDTLESFSHLTASREITLQGDVAQNLGEFTVDPVRISRVINNLLENSLNHTSPGGRIQLNAFRKGGQVIIQVCDSGSGISPDELPYIFDRFYRGEKWRKSTRRGSGLGLAISKGIVEAHGGSISVNSQPGWTIFSIALPGDHNR